jgi:hypothetical protein
MRRFFGTLVVLLAVPSAAAAHLLDEYLQATRIAVARDRIVLEINLTPGAAVAPEIVGLIDADHDGQVAASEIAIYAQRVVRDLVLEVDGRRYPLSLTRAECPTPAEMREGAGTIRLQVSATLPVPLREGARHRVRYENAHRSEIGVYLVNALVPASRAITIAGQRRDARQHGITLDVDLASAPSVVAWLVFPAAGLAALGFYRRPRPRPAPCQTPRRASP